MTNLKKSGMALIITAGAIETVISFIAYWIFYLMSKSGGTTLVTPLVIVFAGLLGGVLGIIAGVLVRSTKMGGGILSCVAAGLQLFATVFLIIQLSIGSTGGDAVMIILPFFILPNALAIAGSVMCMVPSQDIQEAPAAAPAPAKVEEKK